MNFDEARQAGPVGGVFKMDDMSKFSPYHWMSEAAQNRLSYEANKRYVKEKEAKRQAMIERLQRLPPKLVDSGFPPGLFVVQAEATDGSISLHSESFNSNEEACDAIDRLKTTDNALELPFRIFTVMRT